MNDANLPEGIRRLIAGKPYRMDDMGMSGSRIMLFDDCVLKIVRYGERNAETVRVMRWLEGKLPVPELAALLAEGLERLWRVDVSDCPRSRDPDAELREAASRVRNHLVDVSRAEPSAFGPGGFRDPEELLGWLEDHRPSFEPVLSHGDFCLPNVFIHNGGISGFIDLGDTGIGDKWRDVALCCRSLKHNFDGSYGGKVYPDFDPNLLFDALGIEPDREKLRYYTLLDELF